MKRSELDLYSDIGFWGGVIAFFFFGPMHAAALWAFVAALEARANRKDYDD